MRDILSGAFLREHRDVDGFTLNLWGLQDDLAALYARRGYAVSFLPEVDFLRIKRDGGHAVFNQLELDGDLAVWRHAGKEGTVYFPRAWLADAPHVFYDTPEYVSGVEFEYAVKTRPGLLNPTWRRREKDRAALDWLTGVLVARGVDRDALLSQIWSDNPYWRKRGYDV